ncbi:RecQ familyATP-dependent DNA helicase [Galbibacter marinus]|uniref:ATP-dependent DNA helicase RecQ n=1 Tax=Galbibacter marinus TaxID=555500 RepID=K2QI10_9FLAO|nr:RecQ family ATP-dependent DNA helicase [Galbibacter marinus]EKF54327.1 RecQ familyATP-dependent DNA helicase [Galbibacter marinus]
MEQQKDPIAVLQEFWGYSGFRPLQQKAIETALQKQDCFISFPTGGGKTLCYQVTSMASEGICIVVSPLIALIENQVADLKQRGIKTAALTGSMKYQEVDTILDNCIYGNFKFLYLSPERLQQDLVQQRIRAMNVNLIAIDEAHCISQWGNDFRPSYRDCKVLKDLLPGVPMMALTASATQKVCDEILENLQLTDPVLIKKDIHRANIAYHVLQTIDKTESLYKIFHKHQGSAIVYVNTRKATRQISDALRKNNISADFFHGGLESWDKNEKLKQWLNNKTRVMVATNAFGMGIDKPDVQTVIHYHYPSTLEGYFQESGRAGRNGSRAYAVILRGSDDIKHLKGQYLGSLADVDFIKLLYNKLNNYFQIPYGEGEHQNVSLNFKDFCNTYKLPTAKTYNGLKVLDRHAIISLIEKPTKNTVLQFTTSHHQLFRYLNQQPGLEKIVQSLLRTYPGIFDYPTTIRLTNMANKTGSSEKQIQFYLEQLAKDDMCQYTENNADTNINFLIPREDDKTINVIARAIEHYNEVKVSQLQHVIDYCTNDQRCKSVQLLEYFDQKDPKDCGICSVCSKKKQYLAPDILSIVKQEVLKTLEKKPQTKQELGTNITFKSIFVNEAVAQLLEEKAIVLDNEQHYSIA